MTAAHRLLLAGAVLVAFALPTAAHAQASKSDHRLSFEKASALSGPAKVERAEKLLQRMKDQLRKGFRYLEQAREEKDIVKLNVIKDKLSQMKGLLKVSEGAFVALQEAVARRDRETADHEYTKIAIASQKLDTLSLEAEGAVGDMLHQSGDTRVDVSAEGMAAEGDVPTGGAGADVPAGAGAGAAGAARGNAGGAGTQNAQRDDVPGDGEGAEGQAGTIDDAAGGGSAAASPEFEPPPLGDVIQPTASPTL